MGLTVLGTALLLLLMEKSPLENKRSLPTSPSPNLPTSSQPCQKRCSTPGCPNGGEKPGSVLVNLNGIPGMLQDQLQFLEMDAGSMGETQMVVLVEVKTLANAVANQEWTGTAEAIQAESQLWSIIKMGFLWSQELPLGPEGELQKCTGLLTPTTGVATPTDCAGFLMASIGKLLRNASSKDISTLQGILTQLLTFIGNLIGTTSLVVGSPWN